VTIIGYSVQRRDLCIGGMGTAVTSVR